MKSRSDERGEGGGNKTLSTNEQLRHRRLNRKQTTAKTSNGSLQTIIKKKQKQKKNYKNPK